MHDVFINKRNYRIGAVAVLGLLLAAFAGTTAAQSIINGGGPIGKVGSDWKFAGTDDLSGDRKADIVWQQTGTGNVAIWLMNGTTIVGRRTLAGAGAGWEIQGLLPVDSDQFADILWKNKNTGDVAAWLMNGVNVIRSVTFAKVGPTWVTEGFNDLNGDGRDDVIWRNTADGSTVAWFLNATPLNPPQPPPTGGIQGGTYTGGNISLQNPWACLNVSSDGKRLTAANTGCVGNQGQNRNSLNIQFQQNSGRTPSNFPCSAGLNFSDDIQINADGTFNAYFENPWVKNTVQGRFSGTTATGTARTVNPGTDCMVNFSATLR